MEQNNKVVLFQEKQIRREWHEGEWWLSVVDVIEVLIESKDPSDYWTTMKRREKQLPTICRKFKFIAVDGKFRPTDCANTEGLLRIIMSIPSPKAEPFKLWLAKVGKERIEEIENPELAIERVRETYRAKGYPDEWIERRLQTIEIRKQLTEEWKGRGVKEGQEYAILTAEIAKATFGLTPTEHKEYKGLTKPTQNLRDHMSTLELIFTALGEEMTRHLAVEEDAQGYVENHDVARRGGRAAGKARVVAENDTGVKVLSSKNFINQIESKKANNALDDAENIEKNK
jgi:DNA-damage-inducible protein D